VVMGLGFALTEEFKLENAVPQTRSLGACHLLRASDVPEIEVLIVEDDEKIASFVKRSLELEVVLALCQR